MLIASQYTFEFVRPNKKDQWREYEEKRAAMIVANQGPKDDTPPSDDSNPEPDDDRPDDGNKPDPDVQTDNLDDNERDGEAGDETGVHAGETMEKTERSVSDPKLIPAEPDEVEKKDESSEESNADLEQWNKWVEAAEAEVAKEAEAKGMLFGEDNLKKAEIKDRANLVKEYAQDEDWTKAREAWQEQNPDEDPNTYRQAFISGRIHKLPWEELVDPKKKRAYITKLQDKQIRIKTD